MPADVHIGPSIVKILLDGNLGVATLHISREVPMGGCSSTVEQSGLRENERTGTD